MFDTQKLEEISIKIKEIVGNSPLADVDKNVNALLRGVFTKMELISREEFDVQAAVLANTRQKLEALEVKFAALALALSEKDDQK